MPEGRVRVFSTAERLKAYGAALSASWAELESEGVIRVGPLLADVVVVYEGLSEDEQERDEDPVLGALEASRVALGYARDAWIYLGTEHLSSAVEVADPAVVIAVDTPSADALGSALGIEMTEGEIIRTRGRDVMFLGDFAGSLSGDTPDRDLKRVMWERLKEAAAIPSSD